MFTTGLKWEFFFSETTCHTEAKEPTMPYYLLITEERIVGFIHFPRILVLCEMQTSWSRVWTQAAGSTSYDDNHYTTSSSEEWIQEKPDR